MNRFEKRFLAELVKISKEFGYVITEGVVEPISDWVEPNKSFSYTTEEKDGELTITGVEMD